MVAENGFNSRMGQSTDRYVSLPKAFATGDVCEWFMGDEICSKANGWVANKMALKLPALLERHTLAVWLELDEDVQGNYK